MTQRKPLVLVTGGVQELPTGDTLPHDMPPGGATNQHLAKIDGTDYNTQWVTPSTKNYASRTFAYRSFG